MLAKVNSCAVIGLDGEVVEVEVDVSNFGLPRFDIVGLPDTSVQEARERVRCAIRSSGHNFPISRITANLAPADLVFVRDYRRRVSALDPRRHARQGRTDRGRTNPRL